MSSPCQAPVSVQCSQQRRASDMYGVFWGREGSLVPIVLSHEAAGSGGGVEGFDVGRLGRLLVVASDSHLHVLATPSHPDACCPPCQ